MKKNVWMSAVPALLLALVLAAGCKQPTVENGPVPVSGVTLDSTKCPLIVGGMVTLTATVEPENAADKTVSWSAEPEGVVTLKADGNSCSVTAESTGTATVTVTTDGGGKTAQCMVTVYDANTMINLSFIAAVEKATNIGWDKNDDGTVSLTDANLEKIRAVTKLDINGPLVTEEGKLTDLSGIEWFTGLTYLSCNYNNLTELDVSKNTALETLECESNELTTLDVSKNTALETLKCSYNELTTLDVSANTALDTLYCFSNQLMTLDVSANTALRWLYCGRQTSDGTTAQTLMLTLNENQKTTWENKWKSYYSNDQNVVLTD